MTSIFRITLLAVILVIFSTAVAAQSPRASERCVFPQINLPATSNGEQAIKNLGDRLPEVAH